MKPYKIGLRIWIAITSIISFLGGWALLSHSGKPISLFQPTYSQEQPAPMPTLAPVPSLDDLTSGNGSTGLQPLPSIRNAEPSFMPRFRTRGS